MDVISVHGIGWIGDEEYGTVSKGVKESYKDKPFPKKNIFDFPFKNFGRLDRTTRMACSAIALALKDAGREYAPGVKQDMGIVSTNKSGCIETDMNYFKDYLDGGRVLGRGNLFIYTLPSSPSGEAAIYFGLQGPVLYVTDRERPVVTALRTASEMIGNNEAWAMFAGQAEAGFAVYFLLAGETSMGEHALCSLDHAMNIVKKKSTLREMIEKFSDPKKGSAV